MTIDSHDGGVWRTRLVPMNATMPATPAGWMVLAVIVVALVAAVLLMHRALPALVLIAALDAFRRSRS